MIEYEKIKGSLKTKSLKNYKEIKLVENDIFELKYIDAIKSHNFFFLELENKIKDWINSLNTELEINNLKSLPNYAFIHYLSKGIYPEDYAPEVGIVVLDDKNLEYFNIDKEEYISKMGDFCFDNCYENILFEIFGLELNKEKTKLIDRSEMFKELKNSAFMDYYSIIENWEKTYSDEFCLAEKSFLIALGKATYDIVFDSINEKNNLLKGYK